jgi:hypothetical protein
MKSNNLVCKVSNKDLDLYINLFDNNYKKHSNKMIYFRFTSLNSK